MADQPTHVVRGSSTYTLCGIHRRDRQAFPYVAEQWAVRNVIERGLPVCDDCWTVMRGGADQ